MDDEIVKWIENIEKKNNCDAVEIDLICELLLSFHSLALLSFLIELTFITMKIGRMWSIRSFFVW